MSMSSTVRIATALAALVTITCAPPARAEEGEIGCDWPVKAGDTQETVRARIGGDAAMETLTGAEGYEFEGMVLWAADPARRVEVLFEEDNPDLLVSGLRLGDEAAWKVAGVGLGDTLEQVREANGAPFELWGFEWDYGGYVTGLDRGRLAALPGGCSLSIRFSPAEDVNLPDALVGEVKISSDDRRVKAARARVSQLVIGFDVAEEWDGEPGEDPE